MSDVALPPRIAAARLSGMTSASGGSRLVLGGATIALLLIVGYPLVWLVLGAFGLPHQFGTGALVRALTRPQTLTPLANTLILAGCCGVLSIGLGVPLAWAVARTDMPLRRTVRALVALAYISPPYLTAIAYIILLGPDAGYINRLIAWAAGTPRGPFNVFSMSGVVLVIALHAFAFVFFMTESALRAVDASLEDSARMVGARPLAVLLRITLPMAAPAITGGALLAAVDSMALFGPQAIIGLPARLVFLPTRIYGVLGSYPPRFAEASALSLVLVVLTALGLVIQRAWLDRKSFVTVGARGAQPRRMALGGWRWPLLCFCLFVVLLAAVAPVLVLVAASFSKVWTALPLPGNLTLEHYAAALFGDQVAARGIRNSLFLATGAALIAGTLGLLIAYIDLRTMMRGRRLLDYLAILPLGLPGTVLAVGVLQAFIRPPLPLYGTIWILLVAYIARSVPLTVRSAHATLRQIDPSLEEAARMVGAGWLKALRRILVPLARGGLVTGFLLAFIPALTELSATILLYTGGTETISVAIFRLNDLGQLEVVAALSVFTIAVILAVSLLLHRLAGGELENVV